jgi:hypothetical protein
MQSNWHHDEKVLSVTLPANHQPPEPMQPGEESLHAQPAK